MLEYDLTSGHVKWLLQISKDLQDRLHLFELRTALGTWLNIHCVRLVVCSLTAAFCVNPPVCIEQIYLCSVAHLQKLTNDTEAFMFILKTNCPC